MMKSMPVNSQGKKLVTRLAFLVALGSIINISADALNIGNNFNRRRTVNQFRRRPITTGFISANKGLRLSSLHLDRRHRSPLTTCAAIPSTMPHADIAVRLDRPVLSHPQVKKTSATMWKSIFGILLSDVAKTAMVAFIIALTLTFLSKSSSTIVRPVVTSVKHCFKLLQGQCIKFWDRFKKDPEGVPMVFDEANDGWGVCTLLSKKQVGRSQFMKYDFKLPKADNTLNLVLGQKLTLCCLDEYDNVAKKDYFLYSPRNAKGQFSVLAPINPAQSMVARGDGDFSKMLAMELDNGDEIALQPGAQTLSYRGEYLPVTDMVYFSSGAGIVPVIDQVKSVLPQGSSSVKSVSVIWTNEKEEDFDLALTTLEDEYFKYSTKLAVSCIVDSGGNLESNLEIEEALPEFHPGTMAVVAGVKGFTSEVRALLMKRGYPDQCICVLPE